MTTPSVPGVSPLLAFQNDPALHELFLERGQRSNRVWGDDEATDPGFFEEKLGIPKALGNLLGEMPDLLPAQRDMRFVVEWLAVLKPGMAVSTVAESFICWLLLDDELGALKRACSPALAASIARIATLHLQSRRGEKIDRAAWSAARRAVTLDDADEHAEVAGGDWSPEAAIREAERLAAQVAAELAWPTATTGSVAVSGLQAWLRLHEWRVRAEQRYSAADEEHFRQLSHAFCDRHADLIAGIRERGESGASLRRLFEMEHPGEDERYEAFQKARRQQVHDTAMRAADRLIALLQASSGAH